MITVLAATLRLAGATVIAVALCCALPVLAAAKDYTEADVNQAVDKVIADRSKDGAFVFHDPKLDADLNLIFEKVKIVRGMEGYGWFANVIFHDKDEPKKQYAIDFWFKPEDAASRSWISGCRRGRSRMATAGSWSRVYPSPGGGCRCRSILATWRSPAPGR